MVSSQPKPTQKVEERRKFGLDESEHRRHGPENGEDPLRRRHRVRLARAGAGDSGTSSEAAKREEDQRGQPERRPAHELPRPPLQPGGDPVAQRAGRDLQRQAEGDEARRRRRTVEQPLADGPEAGGDEARKEVGVELRHRAVGIVQQDEEDGRAEAEAPPEDERIPPGAVLARTVRARPGPGGAAATSAVSGHGERPPASIRPVARPRGTPAQ